ncbi:MAG: hydroxyacylglutathione hydrolase [Hyphomicrobiales bacterium]|nr:hydroxyacylglutathione hydrolase [Hyphomicrobiales bacterium]
MPDLIIRQFPCRSDNYGVLVHEPVNKLTAAIDTPDPAPIRAELAAQGWALTHIFTTHHHGDHTAGHIALKSETGCKIIAPEKEAGKIPDVDVNVSEGSAFDFGGHQVRVIEMPGHTAGHVTYWLPDDGVAFVGDTLFSLGCGRLFEGDGPTMWASLQKLMMLPPETLVYCGHEYSKANAAFALSVEPGNAMLQQRAKEIDELRAKNAATVPFTIAAELSQNPFLRPDSLEIQQHLGMSGHPLATIFTELRRLKNAF